MSTSGDNPASRSRTAEQQVRPLQFQVACPGETARRQRVDASDRFFAVCKLALAFTRGHVRANQEVDQALVHLVGCLLALALATRLACPRSPFTTSERACASNGYPNVSLYLWLALWSSDRAPYNHRPAALFNKNTPTKPYTAPLPPPNKQMRCAGMAENCEYGDFTVAEPGC